MAQDNITQLKDIFETKDLLLAEEAINQNGILDNIKDVLISNTEMATFFLPLVNTISAK